MQRYAGYYELLNNEKIIAPGSHLLIWTAKMAYSPFVSSSLFLSNAMVPLFSPQTLPAASAPTAYTPYLHHRKISEFVAASNSKHLINKIKGVS